LNEESKQKPKTVEDSVKHAVLKSPPVGYALGRTRQKVYAVIIYTKKAKLRVLIAEIQSH
jgi:hypothetical protein